MPRHLLAGLQGACSSRPRLETLDQAASRNSMAVLCLNPQGASQPAAQHSPAAPPAMLTVPSHHLPPAHSPPLYRFLDGSLHSPAAAFPPVIMTEPVSAVIHAVSRDLCTCFLQSAQLKHRKYRLLPQGEETTAKMTRKHS